MTSHPEYKRLAYLWVVTQTTSFMPAASYSHARGLVDALCANFNLASVHNTTGVINVKKKTFKNDFASFLIYILATSMVGYQKQRYNFTEVQKKQILCRIANICNES